MRVAHDIANPTLAHEGLDRIEWAWSQMPVLRGLAQRFARDRPLGDIRISGCLHITSETAGLARVLKAGGADLVLCASNPLSTRDDIAAALVTHLRVPVFARHGEDVETYYRHIDAALDHRPAITLDDGADLVSRAHAQRREVLPAIRGGTEETTTGVNRLRAMAADGALTYPIVAVNDARTKHLFDNRHGTGQSALDGIMRATNFLIAGRVLVVVGYGWCGRGIARRAAGLGAQVVVTEVEPLRALEAMMDGYRVMPLPDAAPVADFVVTATGDRHVVDAEHLRALKDGCVLANAGHFDVEINLEALRGLAVEHRHPRPHVEEFVLTDGRCLRLLAEGRLVNLGAAEGHPAAVMDMSFANQALVVEQLAASGHDLAAGVHRVPTAIDQAVARLKLAAHGVAIDTLTEAQAAYLASWQTGT